MGRNEAYVGDVGIKAPEDLGCYIFPLPNSSEYTECARIQEGWESEFADHERLTAEWLEEGCVEADSKEAMMLRAALEDRIYITESGQAIECDRAERLAVVGLFLKISTLLASDAFSQQLDVLSTVAMSLVSALSFDSGCLVYEGAFGGSVSELLTQVQAFDFLEELLVLALDALSYPVLAVKWTFEWIYGKAHWACMHSYGTSVLVIDSGDHTCFDYQLGLLSLSDQVTPLSDLFRRESPDDSKHLDCTDRCEHATSYGMRAWLAWKPLEAFGRVIWQSAVLAAAASI
eukprot:4558462-Amphidinium_carterae.1